MELHGKMEQPNKYQLNLSVTFRCYRIASARKLTSAILIVTTLASLSVEVIAESFVQYTSPFGDTA